MKRLQLAAVSPSSHHTNTAQVFAGRILASSPDHVEHSLFVPLHYEKNYAYPLIVWLHSDGDDQRQLKRIMPLVSLRNYVAIAPRGETTIFNENGAAGWPQAESAIVEAQWRVTQCVEIAQSRCNIHARKIFIGGYADGGTMALRLALRMPHLFAAAFSIGGPLPQGHSPLVNVQNVRGLPVMLSHGNASKRFSTAQLCRDLRLIHSAGMAAHVRQYPCGDELTTQMLSDVNSWLMERVTGTPSPVGDEVVSDLGEWN
jgi:phospholipase/carboxylesterase